MAVKQRTAVLVVHGMGSQRAQDTVRGIVDAVWFDGDERGKTDKRIWTHPECAGVDIDLTVMTTNRIPETSDGRVADFQEFYWAHLMSETKAVAVLLWLFELGRKGPRFTTGMNALWWCGAVFLCLLLLAISLLVLQGIVALAGIVSAPYDVAIVLYVMLLVALLVSSIGAAMWGRLRLCSWLIAALVAFLAIGFGVWKFVGFLGGSDASRHAAVIANLLFAPAVALLAAGMLMRRWGRRAFAVTYGLSLIFFALYAVIPGSTYGWDEIWSAAYNGQLPWSLTSVWSAVASWTIIGAYLAANAAFLQPYLGDAARYFRDAPANVLGRRAIRSEAVQALDRLHRSGGYDRIIVVAHSLGTVIAYDMLRAYYAMVCRDIPVDPARLGPEFDEVDSGKLDLTALREKSRAVIRKMAAARAPIPARSTQAPLPSEPVDAWLVTDFVTLGSPLTHAEYLAGHGNTSQELKDEFARRVAERDFPTCPPALLDRDGTLAFVHHATGMKRLHHGGVFGLTRWTNLYFPITDLFWGDAIGGPVAPVFGPGIVDVAVSTRHSNAAEFFTHTAYWDVKREDGRDAPHIKELREAINLADGNPP